MSSLHSLDMGLYAPSQMILLRRVKVLSSTCCGIPPYNIVIHFTLFEKCSVLFCVTILDRVTLLD